MLNRALCDTNLKFGIMIKYDLTNILEIGPSQICPVYKMAAIFQWPPTISISYLFQPLIALES